MLRYLIFFTVFISVGYFLPAHAATNYYATSTQARAACIAASPITRVLYGYGTTTFNTCATYGGGVNTDICMGGNFFYYRLFNSGLSLYFENQQWAFCSSNSFAECPSGQLRNPISGICIPPSENPKNPVGNVCSSVGNPINFIIGNKYIDEKDFQESGRSSLLFSRHYNSSTNYQSPITFGSSEINRNPFGSKWSHTYHTGLTILLDQVVLILANNQLLIFKSISGSWQPDADVAYRLDEILTNSVRTGWKLTTPDNSIEIYNPRGDLLSITDINGLSKTLTYSDATTLTTIAPAPGLLIRVTDSFGKQLNFTYDSSSRITTISDPAGNIYIYSYDIAGNLKTITYPDNTPVDLTDNPIKTYVYGSDIGELANTANVSQPNALTGIIDENGLRYATYQYDANGKAISTEHAGGVEKYSLAYSADGTSTTVMDPLSSTRTTTFTTILGVVKPTGNSQPGGSGCSAASNNITYDVNGNVATRTDFNGNRTNYVFDLVRNLETSRTEGLTAAGANTPQTRTITTEWHPTFRIPTKITEPGLETTYTYDAKGNITLKSLKDLVTNKTRNWTSSYTYSAAGILVQKVDDGPRTDVSDLTTYDYYPEDAACTGGHFGCRGQLKQITDALGHITSLSRYSAHGQPELITDPNGLILTMVYDARQRLTSLDSGGELTSYRYDPAGQLIHVTQPNNAYLDYTYDNAHRLTDIKDQLGNTRHYTLDNMGNRTKDELFDPNGQLTRSQSRVYDALSRLQNLVLPQ